MARVLIAGYGDIGGRLGSLLSAQNHEVFGLCRNTSRLPPYIHAVSADLFDLNTPLPKNLDYVFYIVSAKQRQDFAYYQAYVLGQSNLINALQGQTIKRFFFISSTAVFGQSNGEWVNEESEVCGNHFSTQRLLEAEAVTLKAPFPSTIVRFGGIYGPGRTHLIDSVIKGTAQCMEAFYSNRIYADDCATMLAHLMNLPHPDNLYIGVDDTPTLLCEVVEWLAEQLSAPEINETEPSKKSRLQRSNKRLSNAKLKATGFKFKYPSYKEGYNELFKHLDKSNQETL